MNRPRHRMLLCCIAIPSELHRRLRHLVVDEDSSVTAKVIEMIQEGLDEARPLGETAGDMVQRISGAPVQW